MNYFETGRQLYLQKEYTRAADNFLQSILKEYSSAAQAWLGSCYEYGLGVEKNLLLAKDLYTVCYQRLGNQERQGNFGVWVSERMSCLKEILVLNNMTRSMNGIGNVKVIKNINGPETPQLKYNNDETVVNVNNRSTFVEAFHFAKQRIPEMNSEWTCDGVTRFYDGYELNTDHFNLKVRRGTSEKYLTSVNGESCVVIFPVSANLDYLYVQQTMMKKVKDVLHKRAEVVIPPVLHKVSQRMNVPYGKCHVVRSLKNCGAFHYSLDNDITFSASCVQLPLKSLEALCAHELTHYYVKDHSKAFYEKLTELAGKEMYLLDQNLWKEGKWSYLNI